MATTASEETGKNMEALPDRSVPADYGALSNEELRLLLCRRTSNMTFLPVTDETRQTIIAMLEITGK